MSDWPLIKDLPNDEQEAFSKWLNGQTCPYHPSGEPAYYPWDYERWKSSGVITD